MAEEETSVGDLLVRLNGDATNLQLTLNDSSRLINSFERAVQERSKDMAAQTAEQSARAASEAARRAAEGQAAVSERLSERTATFIGKQIGGQQFDHVAKITEMMGPKGLAVAGALMLGGYVKSVVDRTKELESMQSAYNDELAKSAQHFQQIANSQTSNTKAGDIFSKEADSSREALMKMVEEEQKAIDDLGKLTAESLAKKVSVHAEGVGNWIMENTGLGDLLHGGPGMYALNMGEDRNKTTLDKQTEIMQKRQQMMDGILTTMEANRERQKRIQDQRNAEDRASAVEAAQVAAMFEGPARQRATLESEIISARRAITRGNEDRMTVFENMGEVARRQLNREGADPDGTKMTALLAEQKAERARLVREGAADLEAFESQAAARRLSVQQQQHVDLMKEQQAYEEARISATMQGHAREEALLLSKQAFERRMRDMGGGGSVFMERTQESQLAELTRRRDQQVADMMADMNRQQTSLQNPETSRLMEWSKLLQQLQRDLSLTAPQIQMVKTRFDELAQAKANAPLTESIKQMNVELAVAERRISDLTANYRRMKMEHPEADEGLIRKANELQEKVRMTQWAREQTKSIRPELVVQDYARDMRAAIAAGAISMDDAVKLMRKNVYDAYGGMRDSGMANSSHAVGQVDVRGINMDTPYSEMGVLQENGKVLVEIRNGIGQLVAKEGLN